MFLVAGQPRAAAPAGRRSRTGVVVVAMSHTVEPQLRFKSSAKRTDHRRALGAERRLAVGPSLLRARRGSSRRGAPTATNGATHPSRCAGSRSCRRGRLPASRSSGSGLRSTTLPAGKTPTKRDWERLSRSWRRRARRPHRDARGDPRPADDVHRLRLPLARAPARCSTPTTRRVRSAAARTISVESLPVDEAWRAELAELIAIPSVSADPAHRDDVKRAGEWVCEFIRRIGGTAELTPFGERELVLGEIPASNGAGNAPTVLVYNHFDVQPPAPLELWESDPFELEIRGEWAYGRGVADDKGQLWLVLKAAQRLVEAGALPVNLRIAFDGEEEIGGHTIADWIDAGRARRRRLRDLRRRDAEARRADDRARDARPRRPRREGADRRARPALRDVRRRGAQRDPRPHAAASKRCSPGRTAGCRSRCARESPRRPRRSSRRGRSCRRAPRRSRRPGAQPLDAEAGEEFYVRTWAEPSADVNGIIGGKPGVRNTTLSVEASAEFSIRLAPGQDVETVGAAAEQLLRDGRTGRRGARDLVARRQPGRRPRRRAAPSNSRSMRSSRRSGRARC